MIIKTLDDLRQPDDRTLIFLPGGLGFGQKMHPESSAEYWQEVVTGFDLAPAVAEDTRKSFDHLRTVFTYGVLCYEIFTLVSDHALLVIEQALRDRFTEYHQGTVTFINPSDTERVITASDYEEVFKFADRHRKWRLRIGGGPQTIEFNGMLHGLRAWARHVGLLKGQRNRGIEAALLRLRNYVAHPNGYSLNGPVEAARELRDLAEIINQLWGQPTPGGRLYPGPIQRQVVVLAWDQAGGRFTRLYPSHIGPGTELDGDWECVVARAVASEFPPFDSELIRFDARFETTDYPTELLWGPGSLGEAAVWLSRHQPVGDEVEYLDRTFAIRHDGDQVNLPMRPSVVAALPDDQRGGTWYVVRADYPADAILHVRNLLSGAPCDRSEPCRTCHAESLGAGTYDEVREWIETDGGQYQLPRDVSTPFAYPRSRPVRS